MAIHHETRTAFRARLRARPESACRLRRRLTLWLDELGAQSEDVWALSLAVAEAFANAVEHPHEPTGDTVEVGGSLAGETVRVTIRDSGSWRDVRSRDDGGYGFCLMRNLMDAVDVHVSSGGTTITLERRLQGSVG